MKTSRVISQRRRKDSVCRVKSRSEGFFAGVIHRSCERVYDVRCRPCAARPYEWTLVRQSGLEMGIAGRWILKLPRASASLLRSETLSDVGCACRSALPGSNPFRRCCSDKRGRGLRSRPGELTGRCSCLRFTDWGSRPIRRQCLRKHIHSRKRSSGPVP